MNNSGATADLREYMLELPSGMSGWATREHRPPATNLNPEHAMSDFRISGGRAVSRLRTNTQDADVGQRLVDKDFAAGRERRSHKSERWI